MGIRNPIPELVVAPRMVITWPRLSSKKARPYVPSIIRNVHKKFCLNVNLVPGGRSSCSKESLAGRRQKGLANRTMHRTPIMHILTIESEFG